MSGPEVVEGVAVHRDVVHLQVEGYRPLSLDLYVPVGGPRGLCVYTHGGGWLRGSRRNGPGPLSPTSDRLFVRAAQRGLAIASVDYRLTGEARFPAQMNDVDAAIGWLDGHREEYGIGEAPLVTWGVSAGGQLAALRALSSSQPAARACALWYSVTDLRTMPVIPVDDGPSREQRLLGGTVEQAPILAAKGSPVAQVHAGAPPFLILHGDQDKAVPSSQSSQLHSALLAAGATSSYEVMPGYDHMFAGMSDSTVDGLVDRTVSFLLSHV